jgi:hypothetical protein
MDGVGLFMRPGIHMRANGKMTMLTVWASINLSMEPPTMESGSSIRKMALEWRSGQMERSMMAPTRMA